MQTFQEAGLPPSLVDALTRMGFNTPTPIQAATIPLALTGRDVLGSAQTGTGKTGAFGIPLVAHLLANGRASALVLLPTRELAIQVEEALKQMIGKAPIKSALIIGGDSMPGQMQALKARPRLIVGTPGRINDHLQRGTLMLHSTSFLVLDETDRMLDMGFGIQLDAIAKYLTAKRQTLMFSATLPANIMQLSKKYLSNPERISVGSTSAPVAKIEQETVEVSDADKYPRLIEELKAREGSIIVFVKTKYGADKMAIKLAKQGFKAEALHGDLRQNKRERVIDHFRDQKYRILVATDIAARGLDISHVEHVINYDLPQAPEDYIHRIGRTGRAGAEGKALNLLTSADKIKWRAIQHLLNPGQKIEGGANDGSEMRSGKPRKRNRYGNKNGKSHKGGNKGSTAGKPSNPNAGKPSNKPAGQPKPQGDAKPAAPAKKMGFFARRRAARKAA